MVSSRSITLFSFPSAVLEECTRMEKVNSTAASIFDIIINKCWWFIFCAKKYLRLYGYLYCLSLTVINLRKGRSYVDDSNLGKSALLYL